MKGWFQHGVYACQRAGNLGRRLRGARPWLVCALLAAVVWAPPAAASVLYRCVGAQGELAYVSHTVGYHDCTRIGQWPARAARPMLVSQKTKAADRKAVPATILPGKPPRPVAANPAVLKVTPLGDDKASRVVPPPVVWQPLPVVVLDQLGSWLLPRLLDTNPTPTRPIAPDPAPAPATTQAPPGSSQTVVATHVTPPPPRHGAVYRVVEKNGSVMYTNVKALAQGSNAKMLFTYIIECYACNVHSRINWDTVPLHLAAYRDDIVSAAKLSGVDAALLRAVIHAESGFNPRALSYKGAQGLMQLMPATAFELGVGDAFDPAENISGGARYLAELLHDFKGDVTLAAAAYNAGAGAVTKYGGVPPYAETQVYVKRVALLYERYRKALASRAGPALVTAAAN